MESDGGGRRAKEREIETGEVEIERGNEEVRVKMGGTDLYEREREERESGHNFGEFEIRNFEASKLMAGLNRIFLTQFLTGGNQRIH